MIRLSLIGAAIALGALTFSGCTDTPDNNEPAARPDHVKAPVLSAKELSKKLADLSARAHLAEQSLTRLVAVTATDSALRAGAFDKAAAAVGSDTVTALASELKAEGVRIAEAWEDAITRAPDADARRRAMSARDIAAAHFTALEKALKGADAAFLQLTHKLRQARNATGLHPSSSEIMRARPIAPQVAAAVKTLDGWIRYTDSVLKEIERTPTPEAPAEPVPAVEAVPCETLAVESAKTPSTEAPVAPEPDMPESETPEVEPVPGNAADPVPEPVDA